MRVRSIRNNRGAALVVVLFIMVFGSAIVMLLSDLETSSYIFVSNRGDWMLGRQIAEAGMAEAIREVNNGQNFDGDDAIGSIGRITIGSVVSITPRNFNGGSYWVKVDRDDSVDPIIWTLTSTATFQSPLEVITRVIQVVVQHKIDPLFGGGLAANGDMVLKTNAVVDSYDSDLVDSDGNPLSYEDQATNEYNGKLYGSSEGNLGSNSNITLEGSAVVMGDATPGPDGTVNQEDNSYVSGSTTPAMEDNVLTPVQLPQGYLMWPTSDLPDSAETLSPGNYHFTDFELDSNRTLLIEGPATIVISADALVLRSNAHLLIDGSGGPVNIYIVDSTPDSDSELLMRSNSTIHSITNDPTDITIHVVGDSEITLASNARIHAGINAPESEVHLSSNTKVYGAIVADTVKLSANAKVHFDLKMLRQPDPNGELLPMEILSWRIVQ